MTYLAKYIFIVTDTQHNIYIYIYIYVSITIYAHKIVDINYNHYIFKFSDLILIQIWLLQNTVVPPFKKTLLSFLLPSPPTFLPGAFILYSIYSFKKYWMPQTLGKVQVI